jgi:S1-C subfamily serine protease
MGVANSTHAHTKSLHLDMRRKLMAFDMTVCKPGEDGKYFQHSASVIGGNSGGSILNDKGELIGTVTGGLRGSSVGFAVPISFTKDMIRKSGFGKMLEGWSAK